MDQTGKALGTAAVSATASYQIQVNQPLAPGTYFLRVQAHGAEGNHSLPSAAFKVIVP